MGRTQAEKRPEGEAGYGAIAMVMLLAVVAGAGMALMNAGTANQVALVNRRLDLHRLGNLSDSVARSVSPGPPF